MKQVWATLVAVLGVTATGCPDRSISPVDPVASAVSTKDIPVSADLDILFVIDDSSSTRDKQVVFANNYPGFVTALEGFPTGRPNLHLGVVTTSVNVGTTAAGGAGACDPAAQEDGLLQNKPLALPPGCTAATPDRFLADIAKPDGTRSVNYTGSLSAALSCISQVGVKGCGLESPLEAMKRALDGRHPENAGFVRAGAFLAVVILTDEDDCSAPVALFNRPASAVGDGDVRCAQQAYACDQPISPSQPGAYTGCTVRRNGLLTDPKTYADFLSLLKGPSGTAVAVIAGPSSSELQLGPVTFPAGAGESEMTQSLAVEKSCEATINHNPTFARPALRLDDFRSQFGDRGLFRSVCQDDYSGALSDLGALLFTAISPCLEGELDLRDADAANPGLQPQCAVSEIAPDGDATTETVIPRCHMLGEAQPDRGDAAACWWVAASAQCKTPTGLELRVERAAAPAASSRVRVSCALTAP
jgi:hypothetical protein